MPNNQCNLRVEPKSRIEFQRLARRLMKECREGTWAQSLSKNSFFCNPELVSESHNSLILLDAEINSA